MIWSWAWLCFALAIALEVCGTTCMKLSQGFSRLTPSVLVFVFYGFSFAAFMLALKQIDLSLAYAIWAGLGTAFATAVGILWFKEPASALKIISVGLIVIGVVGLSLGGK